MILLVAGGFPDVSVDARLWLCQALDLSDTTGDDSVVETVTAHKHFTLTHFRLCRCSWVKNPLLQTILSRLQTLEAGQHGAHLFFKKMQLLSMFKFK